MELVTSFIILSHTIVPTYFCQGVRAMNMETYRHFIEANALTVHEMKQLDDPATSTGTRLVLQANYERKSTGWKSNVKEGQRHLCGKISNNW